MKRHEEGGIPLRLLRRLATLAALTALLLIAWHGLVRGPDAVESPPPPAARETAVTLTSPAEPLPAVSAEAARPGRESGQMPSDRQLTPVRPQEADASGYVITGRTWADTVYAACPPEGFFG